ncbi:hypothetical protein GCM10019059_40960 [Camelimonas fluminis]|uniref:Uncharacterized protein n=1 Tax=Camelimonas fluminis TaxID=1576911 RepID=A0ABV7UBN0_9HYPH|nr:hypothetical protein [Camelimonas fluminis]GHE77775.1 hypothetical protein GCM10019059_40960 [Camelimonas fluminis]
MTKSGTGLDIHWLGGNCPVQGEGTLDGREFYFRARGSHWTFAVGGDVIASPDWVHEEPYGTGPFDAGWMSEDDARACIAKATGLYRSATSGKSRPADAS